MTHTFNSYRDIDLNSILEEKDAKIAELQRQLERLRKGCVSKESLHVETKVVRSEYSERNKEYRVVLQSSISASVVSFTLREEQFNDLNKPQVGDTFRLLLVNMRK